MDDETDLRIPASSDPSGLQRGPSFQLSFEGRTVRAHPGETIATALLAAGVRQLRTTRVGARPRGLFCAIGACHDCLVLVDGAGPVRACLTPAAPGARVEGHHVDP
jgi:aerobic-type carbon monoxide dehydrogenase small subunit (CoxS/CutS family)